jgi:hypothetical protein
MPVYLKNSVFVHIPKTGGIWVERALLSYVKPSRGNKSIHEGHIMPDVGDDVACFAFVRHPVPWLKSLYHQRKRKGWNWQDLPLRIEGSCAAKNLNDFIDNVANNKGAVKEYFDHYIGKYKNKKNFYLGKTETLSEDLIKLLNKFGENYNDKAIRLYGKSKQNASRDVKIESLAQDAYQKIYDSQRDYYDEYDYGINP